MGVANNYACYRQLYRLAIVSVLFIPVQQFHPTCSHTFYTCSTLYLLKFFGKIFICLVSIKSVGRKIAETTSTECRNSACAERIFIIQAPLELHMMDKSGEGRNEINI